MNYSFIAITHKGVEKFTAKELEELGIDTIYTTHTTVSDSVGESIVWFKTSIKKAVIIATKAQTIRAVLLLLGIATKTSESVNNNESVNKLVLENATRNVFKESSEIIKELFNKGFSFKITSKGFRDNQEMNKILGDQAIKAWSFMNPKVDLKHPKVFIKAINIKDNILVGIDLSGFDLGNRAYKIFLHKMDMKASLAAALVIALGFKNKGVFLDNFCFNGTIAIEAALRATERNFRDIRNIQNNTYRMAWQNLNPLKSFEVEQIKQIEHQFINDYNKHSYSKDKDNKQYNNKQYKICAVDNQISNITSTRRNAKIAHVDDVINLKRLDIDWLELRFGNSVDYFISILPRIGMSKLKELAYQISVILKQTGKALLITDYDIKPVIDVFSQRLSIESMFKAYSGLKGYNITKWVL